MKKDIAYLLIALLAKLALLANNLRLNQASNLMLLNQADNFTKLGKADGKTVESNPICHEAVVNNNSSLDRRFYFWEQLVKRSFPELRENR